jgi:molybdopterin/thiamine biosynthesis adenylyltransferase
MAVGRYARLEQLDWWDRRTVAGARALVAGGGALGNEVLKNLMLVGWGAVLLVDFDSVEVSNLSRSVLFSEKDVGLPKAEVLAGAAGRLNPDCRIVGLVGDLRLKVSAGLTARADVIFGCLDNVTARLALGELAGQAGRLYLDGGLTPWEGTVSAFVPGAGACYACGLTEEDYRQLNLRRSCPAYAARASAAEGVPTTPAVASITAGLMVQQALKWVHGRRTAPAFTPSSQLRIDTAFDRFWKIRLPEDPECMLHPAVATPAADCQLRHDQPWREILDYWRQRLGCPAATVALPVAILEAWRCPSCGREAAVVEAHLLDQVVPCTACGRPAVPTFRTQVDGTEPWLHLSPAAMGFPPWTWLTVDGPGDAGQVCELAGASLEFDQLFGGVRS